MASYTTEADTTVQSMRDQGIADACAGRLPLYHFGSATGRLLRRRPDGMHTAVFGDDADYRTGFAYACAYLANATEDE